MCNFLRLAQWTVFQCYMSLNIQFWSRFIPGYQRFGETFCSLFRITRRFLGLRDEPWLEVFLSHSFRICEEEWSWGTHNKEKMSFMLGQIWNCLGVCLYRIWKRSLVMFTTIFVSMSLKNFYSRKSEVWSI